jgi:putative ABC transport system permease protein
MSAGFHYLEGGPFQGPYDVLVDDLFAKSNHVKAGDTIEILSKQVSRLRDRGTGQGRP